MAILQRDLKANCNGKASLTSSPGRVSQLTRKLYEPEKPFIKLRPAYSVELVLSYVVKAIEIKITAKFRDTEHLRFEDTKRIMSPVKVSGSDFRETGPRGGSRIFKGWLIPIK